MSKFNNFRNLLILAFVLLLLAGFGYKYYEWNTLTNLSTLYNASWTKEFKLVEAENKNSNDYFDLQTEVFSATGAADIVTSYDDLVGKLRLVIANQQEYADTIKNNNDKLSRINSTFLIGSRGDFAKKLLDNQLKYYSYEISNADDSNAGNWVLFNTISVLRDQAILDQFTYNTSKNSEVNIPKYFPDLAPLEKYNTSNFKFEHEDEIKKYLPKGYELLNKYRDYFSSYYSVMKDFINGDYDSATYKLTKLGETRTNLNVSFEDVFDEGSENRTDNAKKIIQLVSEQAFLIKKFKTDGLYKYPLLVSVDNWEEDLVLCQMYNYKTSVYNNITNKYVTSKNFNDLLGELSSVPPNTDLVDKQFNKKAMNFSNNKDALIFICSGNSNNSFTFITTKTE